MKAETKAKWLEALKSGKYKQGTSKLRSPDGSFCCLAVLGEVVGLQISDDGFYFEGCGREDTYSPLDQHIEGSDITVLWKLNDRTFNEGNPDYSNVILTIEAILTED